MKAALENLPIISGDLYVQLFYEKMRLKGESHNMAEMLAVRKAPSLNTDDTFWAGLKDSGNGLGSQFADAPHVGDFYAEDLRKAGGSPAGKVYLRGLAKYPGDPEAWVSGRGDIKRVCESRGWGCEGATSVKQNRDCMDNSIEEFGLDPSIVKDAVANKIIDQPALGDTREKREKLWGETYDTLKPHNTTESAPAPPPELLGT